MIKVVIDGKVVSAANHTELATKIAEIFPADPRSDVILTYTVTKQPVSRRFDTTKTPETP